MNKRAETWYHKGTLLCMYSICAASTRVHITTMRNYCFLFLMLLISLFSLVLLSKKQKKKHQQQEQLQQGIQSDEETRKHYKEIYELQKWLDYWNMSFVVITVLDVIHNNTFVHPIFLCLTPFIPFAQKIPILPLFLQSAFIYASMLAIMVYNDANLEPFHYSLVVLFFWQLTRAFEFKEQKSKTKRLEHLLFRHMLRKLPCIAFAYDKDLNCTYSKGCGLTKIGLKDDEFVGKCIPDHYDNNSIALYRKSLQGVSSVHDMIDQTMHFRTVILPLYERHREPVGGMCFSYDLSDIMIAERAANKSQQDFKALVQNMQDILIKIDKSFVIQYTSRPWLSSTDATGASILTLLPQDQVELFQTQIEKLLQSSTACSFEITTKDSFWNLTASLDQDYHVILLVSDITSKKKQMEIALIADQAKIASKSKSDFIASMSHELRNPLHSILCTLQLLSVTSHLSAQQMNYVEDLNDNAKLLMALLKYENCNNLHIISDVLDMSKIESGKIQLLVAPMSMLEIVETACEMFSSSCVAKGLELYSFVDPNIQADLYADKTRIIQIMTNFVSNAIKYSTKGFVFVQAKLLMDTELTQTIELSCTDTGIGIQKHHLEKLFLPFSQLHNGAEGWGLGLSICDKLAKLMNGKIEIASEYQKGSSFKFLVELKKASHFSFAVRVHPSQFKTALVWSKHEQLFKVLQFALQSLYVFDVLYVQTRQEFDVAINAADMDDLVLFVDDSVASVMNWNVDCKIVVFQHKSSDKSVPSYSNIETVRHPIKFVRLMNVLSGRRSSLSSALLWENNNSTTTTTTTTSTPTSLTPSPNRTSIEIQPNSPVNKFEMWRILLVEDNPVNQKAMLRLLQYQGIKHVECANNGVEALQKIQEQDVPFSVILMDLQMPQMDGFECTRCIRKLTVDVKKNVPIVALTANVWQEAITQCMDAGMNDIVTKPVSVQTIMQKITGLLG